MSGVLWTGTILLYPGGPVKGFFELFFTFLAIACALAHEWADGRGEPAPTLDQAIYLSMHIIGLYVSMWRTSGHAIIRGANIFLKLCDSGYPRGLR